MKNFLKSKIGFALCLMLLSIVFPTIFSVFVWLITHKHFFRAGVLLFLLFGAPLFLAGVFLLLGLAKDHETYAAAGFYYGGLFLTAIIKGRSFYITDAILGFGLAAVIVYLVIARHRPKGE